MNEYGRRALAFWQEELADELSTMPNPEDYFSTLGQEIEAKIDRLAISLAGNDSPGEEYLEKVGRLRAAQQQAEEQVMDELVYSQAPLEAYENEESDPDSSMATWRRWAEQDRADREADLAEQEAEMDRDWRERTRQHQQ